MKSAGLRSSRLRKGALAFGLAGAFLLGNSNPAQAACGTYEVDVFYTYWKTTNTSTIIEPHQWTVPQYASIARYYAGTVIYYYGPAAQNPSWTYKTSMVSSTNGTFVGNYLRMDGITHQLCKTCSHYASTCSPRL